MIYKASNTAKKRAAAAEVIGEQTSDPPTSMQTNPEATWHDVLVEIKSIKSPRSNARQRPRKDWRQKLKHAVMKDVPTLFRIEGYVIGMEQKSNYVATKAVRTKQRKVDFVSDTLTKSA